MEQHVRDSNMTSYYVTLHSKSMSHYAMLFSFPLCHTRDHVTLGYATLWSSVCHTLPHYITLFHTMTNYVTLHSKSMSHYDQLCHISGIVSMHNCWRWEQESVLILFMTCERKPQHFESCASFVTWCNPTVLAKLLAGIALIWEITMSERSFSNRACSLGSIIMLH